jgi:hypothetical protein
MPSGLKRFQRAESLHFITCSCFHRLPLLEAPGAWDSVEAVGGPVSDHEEGARSKEKLVARSSQLYRDEREPIVKASDHPISCQAPSSKKSSKPLI